MRLALCLIVLCGLALLASPFTLPFNPSLSPPSLNRLKQSCPASLLLRSSSFSPSFPFVVRPSRCLFGAIVSGGGNDKSVPTATRNHLGMVVSVPDASLGVGSNDPDLIRVRFKNPPPTTKSDSRVVREGGDIVILCKPGDNILRVGDDHGVKIPRACRTGLCGTW